MPTLGDIVRRHGKEYLAQHGPSVPIEHRRVLALLGACRTGELGCVRWQCDRCGRSHQTPRSCGNRHCPQCQSSNNDRWLTEQSARRLDVPYFLITFTLPEKLRPFVRSQQRASYAALFRAAAGALQKLARDPRFLGAARIGFTAVLHTWGRQLSYHPHLHVLVPAGGVSDDRKRWLPSRPDFFVPVKALSKIFRAKFRHEMLRAGLLDEIHPALWREAFITDSRAVGDGRCNALQAAVRLSLQVSERSIAPAPISVLPFDDEVEIVLVKCGGCRAVYRRARSGNTSSRSWTSNERRLISRQ